MELEHIIYHAAAGEDYDVALFLHTLRQMGGTHEAPIDYRGISNMLSNECYNEVYRQALRYATKGRMETSPSKRQWYEELDNTMCGFAKRLRNNACKSQYIKEYMDCFA